MKPIFPENQYLLYFSFDNGIASENIQFITLYAIFLLVKVILNAIEGIYHCIIRHHLQRDFSYYARKDIFENLIMYMQRNKYYGSNND